MLTGFAWLLWCSRWSREGQGRTMEVAGARRSCARRRMLADVDVAEALHLPSTNKMYQGVRKVTVSKMVSRRRQGALDSYCYCSSELSGGSGGCGRERRRRTGAVQSKLKVCEDAHGSDKQAPMNGR